MSGRRPRISVGLEPYVLETLQRVATVQNRSVSSLAGELLTEFEPGLARLAAFGEAFREMSEAQKVAVQEGVELAEAKVATALQGALHVSGLVDETLEQVIQEASGQDSDGPQPPLSNTGVR